MKFKTRGIVINYVRFRETSIIVRIYTDQFGLKTYILNNVRSRKPRFPISFFQPLTQLDMVVYDKKNAQINRVAEVKCHAPYHSIPFQISKSTVALFLTEILYRILKEEEVNPNLFEFMAGSLNDYDLLKEDFMNFHLQFLLKLTPYFGIAPGDAEEIIREIGNLNRTLPVGQDEMALLNRLLQEGYRIRIEMKNEVRELLLELILLYYRTNFDHLTEIRSYKVLKEVFHR